MVQLQKSWSAQGWFTRYDYKNMDLSHYWHQHIFAIRGRYHEGYRPILYAAIVAPGSLPGVVLSPAIAVILYIYMLLP